MDLAARAAVVQPALDGDVLALVPADVFDVDVHRRPSCRFSVLLRPSPAAVPSAAAPSRACASVSSGEPCGGDLEHQRRRRSRPSARAVSAAGQSIVPSNGTRWSSVAAAVVVHVRRDQVLRHASRSRRRGRRPGARGRSRGRCRRRPRRAPPRRSAPASRRATARSESPRPRRARRAARPAAAAPRCCAAPRRGCCPPGAGVLRPRHAQVHHEHARTGCAARCAARARPRPRACARAVGVGARERQRRAPAAAVEALADRRVHACSVEPGLGEPLLQVGDGRRVVVVEVRPRGEQLDRVEAVRGDLEQVLAASAAGRGRGASTRRTTSPRLRPRVSTEATVHRLPQLLDVRAPSSSRSRAKRGYFARFVARRSAACAACTGCRPGCRASIVW